MFCHLEQLRSQKVATWIPCIFFFLRSGFNIFKCIGLVGLLLSSGMVTAVMLTIKSPVFCRDSVHLLCLPAPDHTLLARDYVDPSLNIWSLLSFRFAAHAEGILETVYRSWHLENSAEAWGRAAVVSTGVGEFKACVTYSLNKHVIPEALLALPKVFTKEAPRSTAFLQHPWCTVSRHWVFEFRAQQHRTERKWVWKGSTLKEKQALLHHYSIVICSNFWGILTDTSHGEDVLVRRRVNTDRRGSSRGKKTQTKRQQQGLLEENDFHCQWTATEVT